MIQARNIGFTTIGTTEKQLGTYNGRKLFVKQINSKTASNANTWKTIDTDPDITESVYVIRRIKANMQTYYIPKNEVSCYYEGGALKVNATDGWYTNRDIEVMHFYTKAS